MIGAMAAGLTAVAWCGAGVPGTDDQATMSYEESPELSEFEDAFDPELYADGAGDLCGYLCSSSVSIACFRMGQICRTASTITLGRATLPCAAVALAVCVNAAGLGAICNRHCPK